MEICQHCSIQLQKEVKCNPKAAKLWNPRWRLRNGCDVRLVAKTLMTTIQANLVPNPSEAWRRKHKFTWIAVSKIFAINLLSQPFLGHQLGFHIFFYNGLLGDYRRLSKRKVPKIKWLCTSWGVYGFFKHYLIFLSMCLIFRGYKTVQRPRHQGIKEASFCSPTPIPHSYQWPSLYRSRKWYHQRSWTGLHQSSFDAYNSQ